MKLAAGLLAAALSVGSAYAQGTLRIAMTVADIPLTTGQPDQGMEGYRFTGYTIYDSLVNWDLSRADVPPTLKPGLAESWEVDKANPHIWRFHLRQGVKFHDGSAFNADAAIWNLDKIYKESSPQFDGRQSSQVRGRIGAISGYRAVDANTIEITTEAVDAFFPYEISYLLYSSPAQWEKFGHDWAQIALHPSGTGPFKVTAVIPRQRIELERNAEYWDPARRPKLDKLILIPTPEAATRTAALLSHQVDWIEAPAPDSLPQLKSAGMVLVTNTYPHIWPYEPSRLPGSPWNDIRVRKAVNLAIDRDGLTALLGGTMTPAVGYVLPNSPWFGTPSFHIHYDPAEAKRLLNEAGFTPAHPLHLRVAISTSGSGQMQPQMMNEFIQQNLAAVGVDLQFEVLEWETLRGRRRVGAQAPVNKAIDAINNSYGPIDPATAFVRQFDSKMDAPVGFNWGQYRNPAVDDLLHQAQQTFDTSAQNALLAKAHALIVDDAAYVFIAHDLNPRSMSPQVKGFVQAQSWFPQLTSVYMAP
ncbi:ABC transporter substrate-binding protein [Acidisphaera sp. L21]|uniref:ABC transporter substrate-binding protein n=1 Tax=Acidisphaera sp. L21 TaxID=1641851 RepID=UPI00131EB01F|nr:ABC transporter substrate-binding protein [Acidisphaera sp. L21]